MKVADHTLLRHIGGSGYDLDKSGSVDDLSPGSHRHYSASVLTTDDEITMKCREPTPSEKSAIREVSGNQ